MGEVTNAQMQYGEIKFSHKIDETPATSKTNGNVTINNSGTPETPAHFKTSFVIEAVSREGGIETSNFFTWNDVVLIDRDDATYHEVEDQASRRIAPMLRSVADHLEKQLADYDAKRKEKMG